LRLDKYLVEQSLAPTRSQALELIRAGHVEVNGKVAAKASMKILSGMKVEVLVDHLFVGRGAKKLEHALDYFECEVEDFIAADIGASTGGFTEILLLRGCSKVYAIDVGHDQLAQKLQQSEQVIELSGTNAREPLPISEEVDLIVMDVSHISITLLLPNLMNYLKEHGKIVTLFKPQFEVGLERLGKKGVVRDLDVHRASLLEFYNWCKESFVLPVGFCNSPITGKTGNREFFFYFDLAREKSSIDQNFVEDLA
jgi:23S rRNA (cytidine1920-2'-O)/16S rRNA (cytidine1409-2'-O)-methyltransferase